MNELNVLAVMDAVSEVIPPRRPMLKKQTKEARAAVAELVEAATDVSENGHGTAAIRRLRAALAKFAD